MKKFKLTSYDIFKVLLSLILHISSNLSIKNSWLRCISFSPFLLYCLKNNYSHGSNNSELHTKYVFEIFFLKFLHTISKRKHPHWKIELKPKPMKFFVFNYHFVLPFFKPYIFFFSWRTNRFLSSMYFSTPSGR